MPRPELHEVSDLTHIWAWALIDGKWLNIVGEVFPDSDADVEAELDAARPGLHIRLRVVDQDGRAIPTACARLVMHHESGPDPFLPVFHADAQGVIQASGLTFQSYFADVSAPGYAPARRVCRNLYDDSEYDQGGPDDVVLSPARAAIVEVLTEDGRPVQDPELTYQYPEPGTTQYSEWATLPVAGSTFVLVLPVGRETYLRVSAPGFAEDTGEIGEDASRVEVRLARR